ncbi:MAG: hypothetical protein ACXU9O_10840 [Gemmatimonadaceae bacterium]
MTLDRRRFLQLAATGMVAGLTSSACARDTSENAGAPGKPALVEMLGPDRAREIGTEYRAAVPGENTAAALRDAISSSQHRQFPWIHSRSIEEQIHDDFAAGRTVVVNGWVLSQTEARQCALYSLTV